MWVDREERQVWKHELPFCALLLPRSYRGVWYFNLKSFCALFLLMLYAALLLQGWLEG